MDQLLYLLPVVMLAFMAGMFTVILYGLSRKSWAGLAAAYRFTGPFTGERLGVITAWVNGVRYRNALVLDYNPEGFYLRPIFLFRPFHDPVFVPWQTVKAVQQKTALFTQVRELAIGEPVVARLQLPEATYAKLKPMLRSALGSE